MYRWEGRSLLSALAPPPISELLPAGMAPSGPLRFLTFFFNCLGSFLSRLATPVHVLLSSWYSVGYQQSAASGCEEPRMYSPSIRFDTLIIHVFTGFKKGKVLSPFALGTLLSPGMRARPLVKRVTPVSNYSLANFLSLITGIYRKLERLK